MRTRRAAAAAALLLLTALAACGDAATAPAADALTGDWGPSGNLVGSRWTMHLVERGAAVTGTGDYAFEAGRSGTLTVTGTVAAGGQVTLDIAYDYGMRERFVGVHTPLDVLHGTSTRVLGADSTTTDSDFYRRGTI